MSAVISQDAKSGFNHMMIDCLDESCHARDMTKPVVSSFSGLKDIDEEEFFMLTVCSYTFKAFNFLHFTKNAETVKFVAAALDKPVESIDDAQFYDYLGEVGNTFSGAFKRELGKYIPHLGMSTPNKLSKLSLLSLDDSEYGYESHYVVKIDEQDLFYGSIYVEASEQLDFKVAVNSKLDDDLETGELEFF